MGSHYRRECCGWCICTLITCGCIIFITGLIGYPISKHENNTFDETVCNITSHQDLDTKTCRWCDDYCNGYSCNCNSKGTNCGCCHACHYIDYTCYAAVWNVEYKTLDNSDNDCPKKVRSNIRGDWKKSDGYRASEVSRDKATRDLKKTPVNSERICYYKSEGSCKNAKWGVSNVNAWFITLISGAVIFGTGLFLWAVYGIAFLDLCRKIGTSCNNCCNAKTINKVEVTPIEYDNTNNITNNTNDTATNDPETELPPYV